MIGVGVFLFAA